MYKDASELMSQCKEQNKRIWQIAVENEMKLTSSSYEDILSRFDDRLEIMFHSAQKALNAKQATQGRPYRRRGKNTVRLFKKRKYQRPVYKLCYVSCLLMQRGKCLYG